MTASSNNPTTGAPIYLAAAPPDTAVDMTEVAAYAGKVGTRLIGSTAERTAYDYAREGLGWFDTAVDTEYLHDGTNWDAIFHDWKSWTPTLTGLSLGNGTRSGKYQQNGRHVHYALRFTAGSTTSASAAFGFSTPVTPADSAYKHVGTGVWTRAAGIIYPVQARIPGGSIIYATLGNSAGPIMTATNLSNTYPGALANGDALYMQGSYEVD
ncbi:hypothetical protein [Microbacterium sulfonylureivorans]|uniref:hypothetical protein n=1 Tax=Microbacterium sulfonylureivorans TaxID=2486854 RepID=UPI000FD8C99E|nr:hypothetical protein [Microbacterium sulfonylureivorans]